MTKLVIAIALVCLGLISAGGSPSNGGGRGNRCASTLCKNSTLAQAFLTQAQAVFTELASNASFTQVLQDVANEAAYIQNATNTALLSSNCTQYFVGLDVTINLDIQAQLLQEQYVLYATRLFNKLDADCRPSHGHRYSGEGK